MISVVSSSLRFTQRPTTGPITPSMGRNAAGAAAWGARFALASSIELVGTITLQAKPGESVIGWSVGFLQAQWIETNWGAYRGAAQSDGSLFIQRGRPPGRPSQACFDSSTIGAAYYATTATDGTSTPISGGPALPFSTTLPVPAASPLTINILHRDTPGDWYAYAQPNTKTGKVNLLQEAQLEFAFCTVMVLRGPGNSLQFLKGFYWNVNWQARFSALPGGAGMGATPIAPGVSCNIGGVFDGRPNDHRFLPMLLSPQPTNCNAVASAAASHPNIREAAGWAEFDVRQ